MSWLVKISSQIQIDSLYDKVISAVEYFVPEVEWDIWDKGEYAPSSTDVITRHVIIACGPPYDDLEVYISWRFKPESKTIDSNIGTSSVLFYSNIRMQEDIKFYSSEDKMWKSRSEGKIVASRDQMDTPTEVGQFIRETIDKLIEQEQTFTNRAVL